MRAIILTGVSGGLGKSFFNLFAEQAEAGTLRLICLSRRFLPEQEQAAARHAEYITLVKQDLSEIETLPTAEEMGGWLADPAIDQVVLLSNAATVEPIGAIGELENHKIELATRLNFAAPMVLANNLFAVPKLAECRVQVLSISSGAAKHTIDGWALYCATKAGLEMFFDTLGSRYAGDDRVQVHNIDPGVMDTPMQELIRGTGDAHFPTRERFVNLKAQGQIPSPDEVAAKIVREHLARS